MKKLILKLHSFRIFVVTFTIVLAAGIGSTPTAFGQSTALIDVNSADAKTLATLPGIGATTAQRIVDGRPYSSLADLKKVKGLSQTKINALQSKISFNGTPASALSSAAAPVATTATTAAASASNAVATTTTNAVTKVKHARRKAKTTATNDVATATSAVDAATSTASSNVSSTSPGVSTSAAVPISSPVPKATHTTVSQLAPGEKININTASADDLDKLPGIGKVKAQAIIAYRTQNGPFQNLEDIQKVKGIKTAEFAKLKDSITLGN